MIMDYLKAHENIRDTCGKAAEYPCISCGKRAKDWAYQYPESASPLFDRKGRPYTTDPADYAPMCFGCHITFDRSKEKRLRDVVADNARRSSAALAERRKTDPELDERMKAASRRNLELGRSPEQARAAGAAGGAARAARYVVDPVYREEFRTMVSRNGIAAARATNAQRVVCADCGLASTPGPMGRHFRASGHTKEAS